MVDRLAVLMAAVAVGALLLGGFQLYRRRWTPAPETLQIEDLGLELMEGCCAFVLFTSPACKPCKAALKVVQDTVAAAPNPTEVVAVDAMEHPDLAVRYEVRTIPTVFLITASGHVVKRWREVPEPADARDALAQI